jgi:hypothetical protein
MNFSRTKAKLSLGYLFAFIVFFISFYLVDELRFARFLGFSAARFLDELFLLLLLFGFYLALKSDVLFAGCGVGFVYSILAFPSLSQWHQELGIYDGAFSLITKEAFMASFSAAALYSIVVPIVYLFRRRS